MLPAAAVNCILTIQIDIRRKDTDSEHKIKLMTKNINCHSMMMDRIESNKRSTTTSSSQ